MSHHAVQFSKWTETYQLGKVFQLDYFVPKNSYFEKHPEAYLYHLQIKFKHKIPLSSKYIIQFYKGDSPSWEEKGKGFILAMNETL